MSLFKKNGPALIVGLLIDIRAIFSYSVEIAYIFCNVQSFDFPPFFWVHLILSRLFSQYNYGIEKFHLYIFTVNPTKCSRAGVKRPHAR